MRRVTAIRRLRSLKGPLSTYGVTQLGLFGSTVRGENTRGSDIDILLDFAADKETYQNFLDACQMLQDSFKHDKIDVVTRNGLSPYIGATILNEVEYV
ncbi:MAG: nucleotidyltransferase family protein [Bacteroidaceae bacterium]|nr:nucleotidyltransferase family protein [Bacteroidaceae bacterium]